MLRKYETLFIVRPDLPEEQMANVKERATAAVNSRGGIEVTYQDWGKKRLAYPVKKVSKGNFVYFRYLAGGEAVSELERVLKVHDDVLRFLTVKLDERIDPASFSIEEDCKGIYPFNIRPREPSAERPAEEGDEEGSEGGEGRARRSSRWGGETAAEAPAGGEGSEEEN
ncbi:MAG: 30S ribosomal protein S6 [Deltaproteobacteria bacterium]|nr:30S ribosomal protein S6 [Deltaproteobacteria bacterium]